MAISRSKELRQNSSPAMLSPVFSEQDPLFLVPFVATEATARGVQELTPDVVVAIGIALSQLESAHGEHAESPWARSAIHTGIMNRLSTGV